MNRINQLTFYDESKLGVSLLILFMCLSFYYGYGPLAVLYQINVKPGEIGVSGIYDVFILLVFAIALGLYRHLRRDAKYKIQPISLYERPLIKYCKKICSDFTSQDVDILTTSTMGGNAFYQKSLFKSAIVIEKGLVFQFEKGGDISGIIAHECAHIVRKDFWYITFALNVTYSYIFLSILKILLIEGYFWSLWYANTLVFNEFSRNMYDYFISSLPRAFYNISYNIMFIVTFSLIIRHFIRIRELLTDEFAAQKGYRKNIVHRLAESSDSSGGLLSFHPTVKNRKDALVDGQLWGKINYGFVFSTAFMILSMISLIFRNTSEQFSILLGMDGENVNPDDILSELNTLPIILMTIFALVLISMVVLNHINRVASTLIFKNSSLSVISWQMVLCLTASSLGCIVAILFGNDLARIIVNLNHPNNAEEVQGSLVLFVFFIYYFSLILCCGFISSFIYMRGRIRSHAIRVCALFFIWVMMIAIISTVVSFPLIWLGINIPAIRPIYLELSNEILPSFSDNFTGEVLKSIPILLIFMSLEIFIMFLVLLIPLPRKNNNRNMPYGLNDNEYLSRVVDHFK